MPTDAELKQKYNAYLRGEDAPQPITASGRVEEIIRNAAKAKKPVDFDVETMISNIPASGIEYGEDIYKAVASPIDTAKGLGKAALGGIQKLIPGEQEYEPIADAVGQHYASRYGGIDEFKATLMGDPIGVLGDTAGLLSGVGMLPKLGKVGRIGSLVDPANLAISGGSKLVSNMPGITGMPASMYASAAKIPSRFDEAAVTKTALDKGIMPTPSGLAKADDIITSLNDRVTSLIEQSANSGEYVSSSVVFKALDDVKKDLGGFKFDAADDIAKIDAEVSKFQKYLDFRGQDFVSIKELQEFKTSLYDTINFKRKSMSATPVDEAMRKNMAKSAKLEIEANIPEVKGLNLKMGDMLELVDALQQPSKRIGRRDILGLGAPMKATAGGVAGGVPGAAAGLFIGFLDNPRVKARLEIGRASCRERV